MSFVDEQGRGADGHLLLNLRIGTAGDMHGRDDDVGAVEELIDLGSGRGDVRQAGDHGIFRRSVETALALEDAEGLELAGDLVAKGVGRDHDQQPLEALAGVQGQHRFGFAGPGRHDDGCRLGRARRVSESGVERADLRPPEAWRGRFAVGGRSRLAQVKGVLPGRGYAVAPARHLGTA